MRNQTNKIITKRKDGSIRIQCLPGEESMTQQHHKDQCDINHIMKKYSLTGEVTHLNKKQGVYLDVASLPSYGEALDTVTKANSAFETIPSELRAKLSNNPERFIDFLNNPNNREEAIKYGLLDPLKTQTPQPIPETKQKTKTKNDDSNDDK